MAILQPSASLLTFSTTLVVKSFICRGCLNPVTSAGRTSVDIGASAELELVDKFCYLFDILSVQATGYASQHKSVPVPSQDKLGGLRGRKGILRNMGGWGGHR